MKPRATLCHYNIPEIKNVYCQPCEIINGKNIKETMNHIFYWCDIMGEVWSHYSSLIFELWDESWLPEEQIIGPLTSSPTKNTANLFISK